MTRKRHWIEDAAWSDPWWRNGAWWALIVAVLIGVALALAGNQLWTDVAR